MDSGALYHWWACLSDGGGDVCGLLLGWQVLCAQ